MTALAYAPLYSEPAAIRAQSNTASEWGQRLSVLLVRAAEHARSNATDWRALTNARIEELASEIQVPNWDGYGAQPITTDVKDQAQRFVDLLPYRLPAPEPMPDPDGEIALAWDFGPGSVFTVTIAGNGTLTYAGLLGGGVKRHGVERFNGDIPESILRSIEELTERSRVTR